TRFSRDWSSDVCSSDLLGWIEKLNQGKRIEGSDFKPGRVGFHKQKPADFENFRNKKDELGADDHPPALTVSDPVSEPKTAYPDRSEERRVGKEYRSRSW